jgi:hypothetical protein
MKKTANKYQLQYTSTEVHDGGNKSIRWDWNNIATKKQRHLLRWYFYHTRHG